MKKKILVLLLCGAFAVGMVGCNSSSDTAEQTDEAEEQADEAEEETGSDAQTDESAAELLDEYTAESNELSSKKEYIDKLLEEGYSEEDAKAAVDAYDYDWEGLALKDLGSLHEAQAEEGQGCSPNECSDWLAEDGFSSDEIDYALANSDIDWNEEAVAKVNSYLEFDSDRDREDIIRNLETNGFSSEQAEHGADNSNLTSEE